MPIQTKTISKLLYSILGAVAILGFGFIIIFFTPLYSTFDNSSDTVTIYYVDNISEAHQMIIDKFNEQYENRIYVESINLPFTKFTTNERKQLITRYLRNESDRIDIISIDQIWVPRFSKWCEPLDTYLDSSLRNKILPVALDACYYEQKLVALPLFLDIGLLYYREDLIKTLPDAEHWINKIRSGLTWQDFTTLKKLFPNRFIYIFQGAAYEGLMCNFIEQYYPFTEKKVITNPEELTNKIAALAVTQFKKFIYEWNISPSEVTTFKENESFEFFIENEAVFLRGWPNTGWQYKIDYQDTLFESIKKAPLPYPEGKSPAYALGGWNLMLTRFSKHKTEAMEFIKFFLDESNQKIMFEFGGYTPVNKFVYSDSSFVIKHADLNLYNRLFQYGVIRPQFPYYTKLSDILSKYINKILTKRMHIEEILLQAKQQIESSIINKNFEFYYDSLQTIQ